MARCISSGKIFFLREKNICYHSSFSLPEYASWKDKYSSPEVCGPGSLSVVPLQASGLCWLTSVERCSWLLKQADSDSEELHSMLRNKKLQVSAKTRHDHAFSVEWTVLVGLLLSPFHEIRPHRSSLWGFPPVVTGSDVCVLWTFPTWDCCVYFPPHARLFSCLGLPISAKNSLSPLLLSLRGTVADAS